MTTIQHTLDNAKSLLHAVQGNAEHAVDSAKTGAEHVASTARSSVLDSIRTVADLIATVRSLRTDDALGWAGLERRRGPLASIGTFGLGVATGAGVALLLAPMKGAETRRAILQFFTSNRDPKVMLADAGEQVKEAVMTTAQKVEHGASDVAHKVQHGVSEAAQKMQHGASEAGQKVQHGVSEAGQKAQNSLTEAGQRAQHTASEAATKTTGGESRAATDDGAKSTTSDKPASGRSVTH